MMLDRIDDFFRSNIRSRGLLLVMVLSFLLFPLKGWSEDNIEKNIRILQNQKSDWFKRVMAAKALGKTSDSNAVKALIKAARADSNATVRTTSFEALGLTGTKEAVKFLADALGEEKDWVVRKGIVRGLGVSGNPEALSPLIQALEKDPNVFIRKEAALSLGKLGDRRAIDPLKIALKEDEGVVVHRNADKDTISVTRDVAVAAAASLEKLGVKVSKGALDFDWIEWDIRQLSTNGDEKRRAASAWRLGMSKSKKVVDPLIQALLEDPGSDVRRNAATSLAQLGYKKAIDPLIQAMEKDTSFWVRVSAARALARFGDKKSLKAINKALEEKNISARSMGDDLKKIRKNSDK